MKKTGDKFLDLLYICMDYVIILGIAVIVILIVGAKLDILFNDVPSVQVNADVNETNQEVVPGNTPADVANVLTEENTKDINENKDATTNTQTSDNTNPETSATADTKLQQKEDVNEIVKIVIPQGATTKRTGEILEKSGLVKDAKEFENKAVELKYDRIIKSGTFEIPKNTSMEEILKIISKRN